MPKNEVENVNINCTKKGHVHSNKNVLTVTYTIRA